MDRNSIALASFRVRTVALRKESVDRNIDYVAQGGDTFVALRKESVDRNSLGAGVSSTLYGRSPQGERG